MLQTEERSFSAVELSADEPMKIAGIAVPYGQLSVDLGGFRESFVRGAFADTLASTDDIWLLWAHDLSKPLASRSSGNLTIQEQDAGLRFDANLNDTTWSKDAHQAIRSGTVRTVSFRFTVPEGGDAWTKTSTGLVRTVSRAVLQEISPTPLAAYPQTSVGVRSAAEVLASRKDLGLTTRDLLGLALEIDLERTA